MNQRLKIAVQKKGRLAEKSLSLLGKCGLGFDLREDRLIHACEEFPADLMLVRDDDIPEYVADGVCHLGLIGQNILEEKRAAYSLSKKDFPVKELLKLGFGHCRLSLAVPVETEFLGLNQLQGRRIATSYPGYLRHFLLKMGLEAQIIELSGSVEIATGLGIADAVCDLVSTGGTLKSQGLKEILPLFESQATLVQNAQLSDPVLQGELDRLVKRIQGVLQASQSKYIMMNAPKEALSQICKIIPGMEEPSVMPLGVDGRRIAIHAVARETLFWETLEKLKSVGASSILVLPIEKVIA